jgi:hypothetical protein
VKSTSIREENRFSRLRSAKSLTAVICSTKLLQIVPLIACFLSGMSLRAETIEIHSPANNATLASPAAFSVTTSDAQPASLWVYDNGSLILQQWASSLTSALTLTSGSHTIVVAAWRGTAEQTASVSVNVSTPGNPPATPPPAPPSGSVATQISNDMTGSNEGFPQGVPSSYDWYSGPTLTEGNNPAGQQAITAWGVVYVASQGSSATNTWVNVANMQTWILSKSKNTWSQVQLTSDPDGAAYPDNFQGNSIAGTTRVESDGTLSVHVVSNSGYNFHFYPDNRGSINSTDIGGVVTVFQARLVVGNPALPDDRASANYLCGDGADYYPAVTGPGIENNPSIATGKMKYVTNAWRSFAMTTMSASALASNPPPINLTGVNP